MLNGEVELEDCGFVVVVGVVTSPVAVVVVVVVGVVGGECVVF